MHEEVSTVDATESSLTQRGALHAPHTVPVSTVEAATASRVVRVPLERPDDAGWRELVDLAREAACFANGTLASWWAEAHGWQANEGQSAFKDFKGKLSGDVRVAVQGEVMGVWKRHKSKILRRDMRLPAFASDRSLCVRGKYAGGAGGVRFERDGDGIALSLLLTDKEHGHWRTYRVWDFAIKKDKYLLNLLDKITSGEYRCAKVAIQIDRINRKLYAMCAYIRPVANPRTGTHTATLGPLEADGSMLLRSARATRDFTREVYNVRSKKDHYEGIVKRFRASVGRGPRWRQVYRRNLPPSYSEWATGKLHQLSAEMVAWCVSQKVDRLVIAPISDGHWPAHQLQTMLTYKCQHHGITVDVEADLNDPSTERAAKSPVNKAQRKARRIRQAVKTLRQEIA